MTAPQYTSKAYIVAGDKETMNCQIHALSILLFAIVCNDDFAAPKKI